MEQVADFDAGALAERGGLDCGFHAGIDLDRPGMRLGGMAGRDRKPRDRADRRQGFAAEAQRADRNQIVVGKLRSGVALDREREIGGRHAFAVIAHADRTASPAVGEDVDARCAGIERILQEFLDHARRPLDHFARGDAVDDGFAQLSDRHDRRLE